MHNAEKKIDKNVTKAKPSVKTTGRTRRESRIDKKWPIAMLVLLVTVIICILLNNSTVHNDSANVSGSLLMDNGDQKINWGRYTVTEMPLTESVTITKSGIYHITGTLDDGSITIDSGVKGEVKLILDNVSISNSSGPAISCISGDDLVISSSGESILSDGSFYSANIDEDISGVIYSKADLTLEGTGTLDITANYKDAIVGKDDVKFNGGTYNINSVDDGIRGKDSVYIVNGTFNIITDQDGIKSTNGNDAKKGFILIENGDITISAKDDAIHAEKMFIMQNGKINIIKSYEGLESPQINIYGGDISISASDDGINAGGGSEGVTTDNRNPFATDENCKIDINGGNIYINASGDGIDSNGYVYFNGGKVVVDGPTTNGNGALDSGGGIVFNGGEVVAVGASGMAETMSNTSSAYSVNVYFPTTQPTNTKIEIKDAADNTIAAHTSVKTFSSVIIGSYRFNLGETYSVYINDTKYQDFTANSTVTTIGNSPQNPGMPPQGNR